MLANQPAEVSLSFRAVTAGYQKAMPVLDALSLEITEPGLYQVAGGNGSGKSTLLELISGFLEPWSGSVHLCGKDASSFSARNLRSVCRTAPAVYPSMTVRDHLSFAARARGLATDAAVQRAMDYGLTDWLEQPASALSTGNQRKLWILMCTIADTPVTVLDEPFNALDQHGIDILAAELRDWATTRIVMLISHVLPAKLAVRHSFLLQRRPGQST
ncbi:ATP-binding cassette domain-containing protein [Paenarthrobacter nicotinovorans]|uniref:ABC transporter ATP-binding protein n=1 Tax=Paenarthrobacter nicotinovorans TaxID=29320 RepID=UPI001642B2C1|nr:ATP-binding cassette domain-containing protein [Paenarthrobacter nicotinovorans]